VYVHSLNGARSITKNMVDETTIINLETFAKGIYLVTIVTEESSFSKKIVVDK